MKHYHFHHTVSVTALAFLTIFSFLLGLNIGTTFPSESEQTVQSEATTKQVSLGDGITDVRFDVPTTWSVLYQGGVGGSVAANVVSKSDWNSSQIDVSFSPLEAAALVQQAKANQDDPSTVGIWSTATVAGQAVDVYTEPLDNGQVTKGGTGGSTYYLPLTGHPTMHAIILTKQAQGDAEFETAFTQLLNTLKITNR